MKIKCEKELEKNNITQRIVVTNDYFGAERIGFSYKGVYKSTFLGRAFWCEIAFAVLTQSKWITSSEPKRWVVSFHNSIRLHEPGSERVS